MKNAVVWNVTRVALVKTDVSEELSASIIRVNRIDELGTTLKNGVFWDVTPCGSCKNRLLYMLFYTLLYTVISR
jgi:hypothetical protein